MYSAAPIKTVTVVTSTSAVKPVPRANGLYSNFVAAGQTAQPASNSYDAAVSAAAQTYPKVGNNNAYPNYGYGFAKGRGGSRGGRGQGQKRGGTSAGPTAKASIYYCECCKISCAGPQTWQEHMAGAKHKKREAAMQTGTDVNAPTGKSSFLKCAVCEITVTGSDAFVAHVNGAKHQKVCLKSSAYLLIQAVINISDC